jgi:hypothetical protein
VWIPHIGFCVLQRGRRTATLQKVPLISEPNKRDNIPWLGSRKCFLEQIINPFSIRSSGLRNKTEYKPDKSEHLGNKETRRKCVKWVWELVCQGFGVGQEGQTARRRNCQRADGRESGLSCGQNKGELGTYGENWGY